MRSLRSRKRKRGGSFFGQSPKMNHIPLSRERSERKNQQFRFYVWFQIIFYKTQKRLFLFGKRKSLFRPLSMEVIILY
ncbi:MAG: hypothetical protein U5L45_20755 [Saprospiraceae bacterium]|nr:hypothetical protein [Saprospiraceae bacterium]